MATIVARAFVISFDPQMAIGYLRFSLLICVAWNQTIDETLNLVKPYGTSLDQIVLHGLYTFDHEDTRFTRRPSKHSPCRQSSIVQRWKPTRTKWYHPCGENNHRYASVVSESNPYSDPTDSKEAIDKVCSFDRDPSKLPASTYHQRVRRWWFYPWTWWETEG